MTPLLRKDLPQLNNDDGGSGSSSDNVLFDPARGTGKRNRGAVSHRCHNRRRRRRAPHPILIALGSEVETTAARRALRFMWLMWSRDSLDRGAESCDDALVKKLAVEGSIDTATVLDAYHAGSACVNRVCFWKYGPAV
ncbi:hypothetical protein Vretimale_15663 [Volvox reticuliferus]|uniref:Uncharacterized protein n=1 Tax=Volvox reticuliferus TaxID=1737510 RepID=A0A8J4CQV0_9CHLO|nr:hypothetical protein Vretifemale_14990 [Volvox reticuliferus]GIM12294.1 hypothetical protein Vretimale_15663 [Volvox reticuliferus]